MCRGVRKIQVLGPERGKSEQFTCSNLTLNVKGVMDRGSSDERSVCEMPRLSVASERSSVCVRGLRDGVRKTKENDGKSERAAFNFTSL